MLWKDKLIDIIFPPRCPICEKIVAETGTACKKCLKQIPYIKGARCKKCGKEVREEEEYCIDCGKKNFHFQNGYAVWNYNRLMKKSMSGFKFHDKQEYGNFYGKEMARIYGDWLKKEKVEALVPVPIHTEKKHFRGYNQAEYLANVIGIHVGIPVNSQILFRQKTTRPQKELDSFERQKNLKNAFIGNTRELKGIQTIALIDDIYTTGSTIEACTKVLLSMEIKEVYFLCACIGRNL